MISHEDSGRPLPRESIIVTRYPSLPLEERLPIGIIRLIPHALPGNEETSRVARAAYRLGRANPGTAIVRLDRLSLATWGPIDHLETGDGALDAQLTEGGHLDRRLPAERAVLCQLVAAATRIEARKQGFLVGLRNFALSPKYRLRSKDRTLGLRTGVAFRISAHKEHCYLCCDMKSLILVCRNLAERLRREDALAETLAGRRVVAGWQGEVLVVDRLLARTVSAHDPDLGCSVLDYNLAHGRYPEDVQPDPGAPVAVCHPEGQPLKTYAFDASLLQEVLDLSATARADATFAGRVREASRMDVQEREHFCGYFVNKVRGTGPEDFGWRTRPMCNDGNPMEAFDVAVPEDNLVFAGGQHAADPERGILELGLAEPPKEVALAYLYPKGEESLFLQRKNDLLRGLAELCPAMSLRERGELPYEAGTRRGVRMATEKAAELEADVVVAFLAQRRQGRRSDYPLLKSELAQRRIASQMVSLSNPLSKGELANLAIGLTAKTGRGQAWSLGTLHWAPQLFVGLGIDRVAQTRTAAVATAFDANGRALDVTVEVFAPRDEDERPYEARAPFSPTGPSRGERISDPRLIHLLEGCLTAFRAREGALPTRVVLHRLGRFPEMKAKRVWEHFDELGVHFTFVEIDPWDGPRLARRHGSELLDADPGTVAIVSPSEAVLVSTRPDPRRGGAARPVLIRKVAGLIPVEHLCQQVFWLSRMHVGSTKALRGPITTHAVARVIHLIRDGLVPEGAMGPRLFFV